VSSNVEALTLKEYGFPMDIKEKFSEITVAQDSGSVDCLTKSVRPGWTHRLDRSG
jgi:hypothetical protein